MQPILASSTSSGTSTGTLFGSGKSRSGVLSIAAPNCENVSVLRLCTAAIHVQDMVGDDAVKPSAKLARRL